MEIHLGSLTKADAEKFNVPEDVFLKLRDTHEAFNLAMEAALQEFVKSVPNPSVGTATRKEWGRLQGPIEELMEKMGEGHF